MPYGSLLADTVQSSTSGPATFKNTSGTEVGTLCRAWVNFNGTGTVAINASFNVSSITDGGTGTYTVNFTNALADANYSVVVGGRVGSGIPGIRALASSSSAVAINTWDNTTLTDASSVNVAIFR